MCGELLARELVKRTVGIRLEHVHGDPRGRHGGVPVAAAPEGAHAVVVGNEPVRRGPEVAGAVVRRRAGGAAARAPAFFRRRLEPVETRERQSPESERSLLVEPGNRDVWKLLKQLGEIPIVGAWRRGALARRSRRETTEQSCRRKWPPPASPRDGRESSRRMAQ